MLVEKRADSKSRAVGRDKEKKNIHGIEGVWFGIVLLIVAVYGILQCSGRKAFAGIWVIFH